jgi:hypothetical protein
MQKHIKTHKTWQSCCSLDSLASKSEGPSGHGDAGTLAPQGHLETRSTVSRTWICLPALQKYVHTSISTIMLCIYILLLLYIYIHTTHLSGPIPSIINYPIFWEKLVLSWCLPSQKSFLTLHFKPFKQVKMASDVTTKRRNGIYFVLRPDYHYDLNVWTNF